MRTWLTDKCLYGLLLLQLKSKSVSDAVLSSSRCIWVVYSIMRITSFWFMRSTTKFSLYVNFLIKWNTFWKLKISLRGFRGSAYEKDISQIHKSLETCWNVWYPLKDISVMYYFLGGGESDLIHQPDWRLTAVTCVLYTTRAVHITTRSPMPIVMMTHSMPPLAAVAIQLMTQLGVEAAWKFRRYGHWQSIARAADGTACSSWLQSNLSMIDCDSQMAVRNDWESSSHVTSVLEWMGPARDLTKEPT